MFVFISNIYFQYVQQLKYSFIEYSILYNNDFFDCII